MLYLRIFHLVIALLFGVLAVSCKRKEEAPVPRQPPAPVSKATITKDFEKGLLCLRIYGTALAVTRPMYEGLIRAAGNRPPALLQYYHALVTLQAGDVASAQKRFADLTGDSSASADVRDLARAWLAACEATLRQDLQPILKLPKPDPRVNPRLASEIGRVLAYMRTELPLALQLCEGAVNVLPSVADLPALHLNAAIVSLALGKADGGEKHLKAIKPQMPIAECEIEKIKLPHRELMRTLRFYDPALLKCWADFYFLRAAAEGGSNRFLEEACALWHLGRGLEAENTLKKLFEGAGFPPSIRPAALALWGQILWLRGRHDEARKKWDEAVLDASKPEAVAAVLRAYADLPDLPTDTFEKGIALGQEALKNLRKQESQYSDRRFRERHKDFLWALGRLCFAAAVAYLSKGDVQRATEHLANAEEIGNRLYEESSRFDLERNSPIFLADLANVYLLHVLALGHSGAYLEDLLRYMYDERMLPTAEPASWQVREHLQTLYALRDLAPPRSSSVRRATSTGPSIYHSLMTPLPREAPRPHPMPSVWRLVCFASAVFFIFVLGLLILLWLARPQQ